MKIPEILKLLLFRTTLLPVDCVTLLSCRPSSLSFTTPCPPEFEPLKGLVASSNRSCPPLSPSTFRYSVASVLPGLVPSETSGRYSPQTLNSAYTTLRWLPKLLIPVLIWIQHFTTRPTKYISGLIFVSGHSSGTGLGFTVFSHRAWTRGNHHCPSSRPELYIRSL